MMDGGFDASMEPDPPESDDEDAGATDPEPDPDAGVDPQGDLEIAGDWQDEWGGAHRIDNGSWVLGWTPDAASFAIAHYDNDAMVVIAENGADNAFSAGLWSRFDWAWDDGGALRYCQSVYDGATETDAFEATPADASDFDTGCGGFSWSTLASGEGSMAIAGTYQDEWGGTHRVSDPGWLMGWAPDAASFGVSEFSNSARHIIAENGADNAFNPGLWSRFDWAWDDGGALRYCQGVFDAATEQAALDATPADAGDFDAGCGGFSWSTLTPGQGPIAIAGDRQDLAGGLDHTIGVDTWSRSDGALWHLSQHDNAGRWAIAQNDAGNASDANLWSRLDWTWDDAGQLWLCHTATDAADEDAAVAVAAADPADPMNAGCGGGGWIRLTLAP